MIPPAGFVAALAGFDRMTTGRLSGLLDHRAPEQAFAIATGEAAPPQPFATLFAREPELAAAWKRSGARRLPRDMWEQCVSAGVEVVLPGVIL